MSETLAKCWKCGASDHWSGKCPEKENIPGFPFRPKKYTLCWKCGVRGQHWTGDCPDKDAIEGFPFRIDKDHFSAPKKRTRSPELSEKNLNPDTVAALTSLLHYLIKNEKTLP